MQAKNKILKYYIHELTHVRVNSTKEKGISPHKPVLILSVITAIEQGKITSNKIPITPELISIFKSIFKRQIPLQYNNTCAISGLYISAAMNISLVDACHIIPFSHSYDDTIKNGILLTPTLHRAFDRGLISINQNYQVIISTKFKEGIKKENKWSITQFLNKELLLAKNSNFFPGLGNLEWHRENIFKK
jgi:predicted restriction endonuclease